MSLDDELAVASCWKPWSPKPGQHIQIRVSEECPALRAAPGEKETLTHYHARSETGRVGRVVTETPGVWNPRQGLAGHDVLVDFSPDAVHFQGCISYCALYFAAEELEPVTTRCGAAGRDEADADVWSAETEDTPSAAPTSVRKPNRSRRERKAARRRARQQSR